MCGICGFFTPEYKPTPSTLERATKSLAHRGPDGMQIWLHPNGRMGLGHTRLAIIDLDLGKQPMFSPDGRFVIAFNGEIYNFQDLRIELEGIGHQFRTRSDTEVLLYAFSQWGRECLHRLDGMFAFAVLDIENETLFLARDRTGVKPLYYYSGPQGVIFGSELKAVLAWPEVPRRVETNAIADFLTLGYTVAPATCFRDCHELEPGVVLQFSRRGLVKQRYWRWKREEQDCTEELSLELLESHLIDALRENLISDVPIGAFLSGGIDSSLLVALIKKADDRRLKTFTVKFGEAAYDESKYARAVARQTNTEHHEITVRNDDCDFRVVERVLDQFDQPFADSSAIPTYLICREIRKHVKVVIGGDGGDEMFGGYPRFAHADMAQAVGAAPRWCLDLAQNSCRAMQSMFPNASRQGSRLLNAASSQGQERILSFCSSLIADEMRQMVTPEFAELLRSYRIRLTGVNGCKRPGGAELMDCTIGTVLPGDYLRKVDVMSSANALEVRVPMLSNHILEYSAQLPTRLKYSWKRNKILLRKLAAKYLPREIVCKKKQGFGIPFDTWLGPKGRAELHSALADSSTLRPYIRSEYVTSLLTGFKRQDWSRAQHSRYALNMRVYSLWALERWLNNWHPVA